jgi:multidrug efflux pump subunit AcrB
MGNLSPKGTIGSVQGAAENIMKNLKLPHGVTYRFWGTSEYFEEMIRDMLIAMALAVVFMYLILASLYESLLMPLLIMVSLLFSFVGAFVALKVTGQNLTMFAMIGLVMLMGLVAKNSILLVDFAIQQTRKGVSRDEAIIRAGKIRLRPILMTTIALIAGMIPLAFALTEVGKFRQSMGITIIGGLISSLLLTLIVIPSMFGWVDRFRLWTRRMLGRPEDREIDKDERQAKIPEEARTPRTREHTYN